MIINFLLALVMTVGSYGSKEEYTIHSYDFDTLTGNVTPLDSLSGVSNPSYLAFANAGATLLAVNEDEGSTAGLTKLHSDGKGHYTPVGYMATSPGKPALGGAPCHLAVTPDGRHAITANYLGGSISVFELDDDISHPVVHPFEGAGSDKVRQASPHPHFTTFTPDGRLMIVNDLGTDRIYTYPIDADGSPMIGARRDVYMLAGSGPRHSVFLPDERDGHYIGYLINEIDGHVVMFKYDALTGLIVPMTRTLADYAHGEGSADIHLSPDGRYLYVSNRLKGDGIAVFSVNQSDFSITPAGFTPTGTHPRNFAITPDGNWLVVACRDSNSIEVYRRDLESGALTCVGAPVWCNKPVCILFNE